MRRYYKAKSLHDDIVSGNTKTLQERLNNPTDEIHTKQFESIKLACIIPDANKLVPIMLQAGFPIRNDNETLLHILAACPSKPIDGDGLDIRKHWLKVLYTLTSIMHIDELDGLKRTPLMAAVQSGAIENAVFLRSLGASLDVLYRDGSSLFGAAYEALQTFIIDGREATQAERLRNPLLAMLIAAGKRPNTQDLHVGGLLEEDDRAILSATLSDRMTQRPRRSIFDRVPKPNAAITAPAVAPSSRRL